MKHALNGNNQRFCKYSLLCSPIEAKRAEVLPKGNAGCISMFHVAMVTICTRRGRTIVDEQSFNMKVPTFGKSLFLKVASQKNFEKLCFKG